MVLEYMGLKRLNDLVRVANAAAEPPRSQLFLLPVASVGVGVGMRCGCGGSKKAMCNMDL